MSEAIQLRREGLYCPPGDFYIDPAKPVARAIVTHAHGDHARPGSGRYWTAEAGRPLVHERLGRDATVESVSYGERFQLGSTWLSLHPAGHMLGSAQVRIELPGGEIWVVSGDFKREPDPSCAPFEVVQCDAFVTESTFANSQFRWPEPAAVARDILDWWRASRDAGCNAVLFCYALGKAQRILAELEVLRGGIDAAGLDPTILLHASATTPVKHYRRAGIAMLPTDSVATLPRDRDLRGRLVLAPPGAGGTPWIKRFAPCATAFASGWMGAAEKRSRANYDRGFVLSDHADWDSLLRTIAETGARRVRTMHGDSRALLEVLRGKGLDAQPLEALARPVVAF